MAVAVQTLDSQTMSSLEALWTLIQGQKKSVQRALAKRLNETFEAEKKAKVKMTDAKLDKSIASTTSRPIYTMGKDESGEEFINRLLSKAE